MTIDHTFRMYQKKAHSLDNDDSCEDAHQTIKMEELQEHPWQAARMKKLRVLWHMFSLIKLTFSLLIF